MYQFLRNPEYFFVQLYILMFSFDSYLVLIIFNIGSCDAAGHLLPAAVVDLNFEDKKTTRNEGKTRRVVRRYTPTKHGHHGGRRSATQ